MTQGRIFSDADLDASVLRGKQIGIIGYGSQGRAQALNLADAGFRPLIGIRYGRSRDTAAKDGFLTVAPEEAAAQSEVIMSLVPDEHQAEVCSRHIAPHAKHGTFVGFATGFVVHFRLVALPDGLKPFMVAPKGPGGILRARFLAGGGIPALVACDDDRGLGIALAYAKAIGCGRAGVIRTTFGEETIADLFGEQCVLSGGMIELMKAAFDTLTRNGCPPEIAYIECISEVEYMASLISKVGLAALIDNISSTAYFGGVTRGRRLIDSRIRGGMEHVLGEIENGEFVKEFQAYVRSGRCSLSSDGEFDQLEMARRNLASVRKQDD